MASKEPKIVIEPKKDEFKQYLEKTGINDKLAQILISLYDEPNKPENAMEFISRNFSKKDDLDTVYLKNEISRLREQLRQKDLEIKEWKIKYENKFAEDENMH